MKIKFASETKLLYQPLIVLSLIIISFFIPPTRAMENTTPLPLGTCSSMEEFLNQKNLLDRFGSWPTAKNFKADKSCTAAGAFLYAKLPNGEYHTLLGLRNDTHTYCNPGGKSEEYHR